MIGAVDWVEAGWAVEMGRLLMHFLWQASLIGVVAALALEFLIHSPRARHSVLLVALGGLFLAPLATWWLGRSSAPSAEVLYGLATLPEPSPWLGASGVVWALGALVQSLRTALAFGSVRRLRTRGVTPASPQIVALVDDLRTRLGVSRAVGVFVSTLAQVPTVVGTLKPVVLLPTYALTHLSPAELRSVIAHELAHVRRFDDLVNWVLALAEMLFFFHPAVWWIAHRLRAEREFCCDDTAVELCGEPIVFARALERLETLRPVRVSSPIVLASQGGPLMQRIQRLVRGRTSERRTPRTLMPVAATLIGLAWFSASANAASPFGPHDEKEVREIEQAIDRIQREITEVRARIRKLDDGDGGAEDSLELGLELLGGARYRIQEADERTHDVRRWLDAVEGERKELHEKHLQKELHRAREEKSHRDSIRLHIDSVLGEDGLLHVQPRVLQGKLRDQLKELKVLDDLPILRERMEVKVKPDAQKHLLKALESVHGAQRHLGEKNRVLHRHLLQLQEDAAREGLHLKHRLEEATPQLRRELKGLHGQLKELKSLDPRLLPERLGHSLDEYEVREDLTKELRDAMNLYSSALKKRLKADPDGLEGVGSYRLHLKQLEELHKALGEGGLRLKEKEKEKAKKKLGSSKAKAKRDAAREHYHRALQDARQVKEDARAKALEERRAEIERLERELKRLQEEV